MTKEELADNVIKAILEGSASFDNCPDCIGLIDFEGFCQDRADCNICWKNALINAGLVKGEV